MDGPRGKLLGLFFFATLCLHSDHLGSTIAETNTSATLTTWREYTAYGARRAGSSLLATDRTFTGQQSDETGLMYYSARYYDPEIGHFVSPDTIVPDEKSVLDYNRYMYVAGNPLMYVDPDGHQKCRTSEAYCTRPGAEEKFILNSSGVTSNDPELAADAVHDLSEKVGGYSVVNELLNGDSNTTTPVTYKSGSKPKSGIVGEADTGCALDSCSPTSSGVEVYTSKSNNNARSITVHELAHVMDNQADCFLCTSLSGSYPEDRYSKTPYVSPSGAYIDPQNEHFAAGVAAWVYGAGAKAAQGYPLELEQEEYLERRLSEE